MKTIADDIAIRPLREDEVHLLRDFLYEAVFVPEGVQPPPRDIIDLPELQVYISGFGREKDDICLVAEHLGRVVGAAWTRIMNDFAHIDGETPSLAISLDRQYRNKGIGTRLLSAMLKLLSWSGYRKVSLSVQKANFAVSMYEKAGFRTVRTTGEEYVMVKDLALDPVRPCGMRPLTEQDIPEMQELFRTTVLTVNARDYTEDEVKDWASCGDSVEHWKELMSANSYIGAIDTQGNLVGFSSMNSNGHLHSMFVHKDWQGKGVASMLLAEVEKMARRYGVHKIVSEVSITARPFFEKRGYRIITEQKAKANKLHMTNYRMEKEIKALVGI